MKEITITKDTCDKCWREPTYVGRGFETSCVGFYCNLHKIGLSRSMPIKLDKLVEEVF